MGVNRLDDRPGERRALGAWLDQWKRTGPAIDDLRLTELCRLDERESRRITQELLSLWRPPSFEDYGAGLVECQHWFARLAARRQGR